MGMAGFRPAELGISAWRGREVLLDSGELLAEGGTASRVLSAALERSCVCSPGHISALQLES